MSITRQEEIELEPYDYMSPMGTLTIVLDHSSKEIFMVSFTPLKSLNPQEVTSIDWYFKDGAQTGWGIGQKGWKHELEKRKKGRVSSGHAFL
ncbi:hypothetical protein LM599_04350 [Candidatus Acetothermia bacterium]|nr:hypothetical protein [Candidatus Acetothermia bacterium]